MIALRLSLNAIQIFLVVSAVSSASLGFRFVSSPLIEPSPFATAGWGYNGDKAPQYWPGLYATCGGTHQSPVDIISANVVQKEYPDLVLNQFSNHILDSLIQNNGHTAMITIFAVSTPSISGGPLNSEYQLYQYHFHWGDNATVGSENKLNGHTYPMELHLVLWNKKYDSYTAATTHSDGLTVMAFFFEISSTDNPAFSFVNALSNIINPETNVEYTTPPNLEQLLPSDMSEYYNLAGSLTTPPCLEIVQWLIFRETIKISSSQLNKFRALKNEDNEEILHNFRPTQPLNDRVVYHNSGSVGIPLYTFPPF